MPTDEDVNHCGHCCAVHVMDRECLAPGCAGCCPWPDTRAVTDKLTALLYDLTCLIGELTNYEHPAAEGLRVSCEAMQNGFIDDKILTAAKSELNLLRRALGCRE